MGDRFDVLVIYIIDSIWIAVSYVSEEVGVVSLKAKMT